MAQEERENRVLYHLYIANCINRGITLSLAEVRKATLRIDMIEIIGKVCGRLLRSQTMMMQEKFVN